MLGIMSENTGATWEREDAKEPHYRALFNSKGRIMVLFCHNTDLGVDWERGGEHPYYTRECPFKKAFPKGINILVPALTQ